MKYVIGGGGNAFQNMTVGGGGCGAGGGGAAVWAKPKTLSAHDQIKCRAFLAAIEEVEEKFGMRLPDMDNGSIQIGKFEGFRTVDKYGRVEEPILF